MPPVISNRALNILCKDLKEIIYSVILIYKFMEFCSFFSFSSTVSYVAVTDIFICEAGMQSLFDIMKFVHKML